MTLISNEGLTAREQPDSRPDLELKVAFVRSCWNEAIWALTSSSVKVTCAEPSLARSRTARPRRRILKE